MVDYIISNKEDFDRERSKKDQIFKPNLLFPDNLFFDDFYGFLFFESDFIYTSTFLSGIQIFIKKIKNSFFTFYSISPEADEYFFNNFGKYGVATFTINDNHEVYKKNLHRDFDQKRGDSLSISGETVAIFSDSLDWGMVASKNWEIGIVGFKSDRIKELYIDSFKENVGSGKIFDTIDSYIKEYDSMFHWEEDIKNEWNKLKKNYSR